ncbi:MAG: AAA family ATPase, partial [Candidatus Omnitrophica bacterium]|nr:AAA family ATPase [Candidatus Omnitrophota bacterium]
MYFKRLELVGFKSFMDKTTLNFEPGVTAVVGPNGCGKSNIFDSIRWVLGEQSAKSLRGSSMEDVIFNGTDTKQPLGMAEVSLTFDNTNKAFPVDYDEVLITRRIFRSGESEYLLNKSTCRLKDIQDLLLGTGIGAESYSIIAQGKIDMILSSRPEDRRQVFDEASGITKYKSQKREAMRRLEETEQNLLRINDIITEVKRSIGYLERQANKARRYQATFDQLCKKETTLAFVQKKRLIAEKERLLKELGGLKDTEETLHVAIQQEEDSIAARNAEIKALDESINETKHTIQALENALAADHQHIAFNRERIKELESTKAYLESQAADSSSRLAQEEAQLEEFRQQLQSSKKALEEKSAALQDNERRLEQLVEAIRVSQEAIARAKRGILDLATRETQAKNELVDLNSRQHVFLARQKRLELEKAKIAQERMDVETSLSASNAELGRLENEQLATDEQIHVVGLQADEKNRTLAEIVREIDDLEKRRTSLESQKEFLEKLKNQYEDITESMNAVILLDKAPSEKINGLVVKVRPESAQQDAGSPASFRIQGEAKPIDLDAQKVRERLAQVVQEQEAKKEAKTAVEAAQQQLTAAVQLLTQRRQEQEVALANRRAVQRTIVEQFDKVKQEEEIIVLELGDVKQEMASLTEKANLAEQHLAAVQEENAAMEAGIHKEQDAIASNSKLKEEVLVVIAQVKTEIDNLHTRLHSEEANVRMAQDSVNISRGNILNLQNKGRETAHRQEGLTAQITEFEEKINATNAEISSKNKLLDENEAQFTMLSDGISGIVKAIDDRRKGLDALKDRVYELQMEEKELDYKYQSMKERLAAAYKIELDTLIAPVEQPQPAAAQAPQQEAAPGPAQPQADLSLLALPAPEQPGPVPEFDLEAFDETALGADIATLKERVDSYGTVNLVAIEEYDELKKRYDFLTQQQTDLVTAKESLQEAIRKINATTRKMFLETFERVREEFRTYFKLLFNGGDAQIYLLDENDPLETGIEIICRPPGKKLQNVLLLSGGEKAMSAIALIFAIFKVKPAPFCVLDEIDAALDESNVDRFGRLLQDFVSTSQFIVITHNKRTME